MMGQEDEVQVSRCITYSRWQSVPLQFKEEGKSNFGESELTI